MNKKQQKQAQPKPERKPATDLQKAASRMNWILGFVIKPISSHRLKVDSRVPVSANLLAAACKYNLAADQLKEAVRADYAAYKANILVGREMEKSSLTSPKLRPATSSRLPNLCCCITCGKPFVRGEYFETDLAPTSIYSFNPSGYPVLVDADFQARWELHPDNFLRRHLDCKLPEIPF